MRRITKENAIAYLRELEAAGDLPESVIFNEPVPPEYQALVEIYHAFRCLAKHSPDGCVYYNETSHEDPWEQEYHLLWYKKLKDYMNITHVDLHDIQSALTMFRSYFVNAERSLAICSTFIIGDAYEYLKDYKKNNSVQNLNKVAKALNTTDADTMNLRELFKSFSDEEL